MSQPNMKTILYVVAGSQAYGMATETSDIDVKGVALGDRKHYLGMTPAFEQIENPDLFPPLDVFSERERAIIEREKLEGTIYELRKFLKLATACNPNLIEVLFCRDEEVRLITEEGRILRKPKGRIIIKCQDQVCAGHFRMTSAELAHYLVETGWYLEDLMVLVSHNKPGLSRLKGKQKHSRRNHSYFLVATLKNPPRLATRFSRDYWPESQPQEE